MLFSIIPHTASELLVNFTIIFSSFVPEESHNTFKTICILQKSKFLSSALPPENDCLIIFYDCSDSSFSHDSSICPPEADFLSYVDIGPASRSHILARLSQACPDLYPILKSQYQLILTQNFLEALQNGYHVRMRDLLQSISTNLEKKVLVQEPNVSQKSMLSSSDFFQNLPEHSQVIGNIGKNPVYYGKIPRKDMGMCLIVPIYRFGEIIEFLIIGNCHRKPEPIFYAALETVISALAIEYEMRQSVFTVVNRSRNGLMDSITNSGRLNPETIMEWAALLGFKTKRLYIAIYLDFLSPDKEPTGLAVYYEILEFMIHYYHPDDYYFLRASSDSLYMIGQFPLDSPEKAQEKSFTTCQQVEHLLKTKGIVKKIYIGIGSTQQQISDISQSYQDALKAIKIAHTTEESIICYETLGILRLLGNIPAGETADNYIPLCLKRLQEYDRKNNTSLVSTLAAYYSSNCNASQAAKALFIHYKTMLNRLDRILQVLNCDYNDSHIRLEIEMGLQIISMHQAGEPSDRL